MSLIVGTHDVYVIRSVRKALEKDRGAQRPDVARELSLAITSLEDAEMRLTRAILRDSRHAADGDQLVDRAEDQLLDQADTAPEPEEAQ